MAERCHSMRGDSGRIRMRRRGSGTGRGASASGRDAAARRGGADPGSRRGPAPDHGWPGGHTRREPGPGLCRGQPAGAVQSGRGDLHVPLGRRPRPGGPDVARHPGRRARSAGRRPGRGGHAHRDDLRASPRAALRLGQHRQSAHPGRAAAQGRGPPRRAQRSPGRAGPGDDHRVGQRGREHAVGRGRPGSPAALPRSGRDDAHHAGARHPVGADPGHRAERTAPAHGADQR